MAESLTAPGNAQTAVTEQVYDIFIKATAEAIFEAITRSEFTARYFYGARIDISPDAYSSHGPDGDDWGSGATLEFDPPHRVVHEWRSGYHPELAGEPASRVTWAISPQENGVCRLTVTHDRLERSPLTARSVSGPGWGRVLSSLKTLLETGEPLG